MDPSNLKVEQTLGTLKKLHNEQNHGGRFMKLYLVTVEGYYEGYGSLAYSVGIFDSIDKAKEAGIKAAMKIKEIYPFVETSVEALLDNYFDIMEFDLNAVYPVRKNTKDEYSYEICTDQFLGGYTE